EQYHLLGHSMGGMIAQEIAVRDAGRVEQLVLYATGAIGVLPGRFETIAQSKARAISDGANTTARRIAGTWFLQGEAAPGYEACANIAEQAGVDAMLAGLDAMEAWNGTAALKNLTAETLVLWGDRDRTYAWEQPQLLWTEIEQASLGVVPGCAHAVHLERALIFNAILRDFLTA
ncbi:MAG: alpha/beta hydrolase, partial [Sulfitobacter sp.]